MLLKKKKKKILNPLPQKISQPFSQKFLNPPQKISQPPTKTKFSPPPENFSTLAKIFHPPPKISQPLKYHNPTRENLNQKNMLTINPPPPSFYLFSFFSYLYSFTFQRKSKKLRGGGVEPLNHPLK